jgi:flagellar L-ring protein precursor FlgH
MNAYDGMKIWIGAWGIIFLAGCATPPMNTKILSPQEKWVNTSSRKPVPIAEGSLWSAQAPLNLYGDVKARNVGDVVTINIVESASASKNATTKTSRNSSLEANWSGVFEKLAGQWVGTDHKAGLGNSFDGKGETTRSSTLNAYITAQVVQVVPNGNLVLQGSRQVRVNNEIQFITIQGMVRPEDISSNNIVLSTYIADATIELNGQGVVSDKQRSGWLTRLLDWAWPF